MTWGNTIYDSTDVTVGTKAEAMWRFLCETRNAIEDLKVKERVFADAYLAEMRKASIPYFFDRQILARTRDEKDGKDFGHGLLGNMFGEDFVEKHKLEFVEVIGYNSYSFDLSHGYYIRFDCKGIRYEFFTPCPRNIEIKDPDSLWPICFLALYCTEKKGFCNTWNQIPGSSDKPYDWKAVCDCVKAFIEKNFVNSGARD